MFLRRFFIGGFLFLCLTGSSIAQSAADAGLIPLAVDQGVPLRVRLTEKVPFKQNARVHGKLSEPVFAFDREVIPAGTAIEGAVTGFQKAGTWSRISAMLSGNFTPLREPVIAFHTLVLANGKRLPLETSVFPGTYAFVEAGGNRRSVDAAGHAFTPTSKKPGNKVKDWLWGMSPYRPQYLPAGLPVNAVLTSPLDFGAAEFNEDAFTRLGTEAPDGENISVRLITPLTSQTAVIGATVEALTTRPVFASDRRLVFPVGSRLHGQITEVDRARARHHNGRLAFTFTSITPPDAWMSSAIEPQAIEGSLSGVEIGRDMKGLRLGSDGSARIVESKKRFIAPAWAFIKAERSLNATADPFGTAVAGAYRGKFLKEVTGGGTPGSFGLPASISGAMFPPVGIGFSFYGAARSIYGTFLKRGRDIDLPVNTAMEIRLEKRQAP